MLIKIVNKMIMKIIASKNLNSVKSKLQKYSWKYYLWLKMVKIKISENYFCLKIITF